MAFRYHIWRQCPSFPHGYYNVDHSYQGGIWFFYWYTFLFPSPLTFISSGKHFKTMQISYSSLKFPPSLSTHWQFLHDLIFYSHGLWISNPSNSPAFGPIKKRGPNLLLTCLCFYTLSMWIQEFFFPSGIFVLIFSQVWPVWLFQKLFLLFL